MSELSLKGLYEKGLSLKDWDKLKNLIEIRSQYYKIFTERGHGKKMIEQVVNAAKEGEKGFNFSPDKFLKSIDEYDEAYSRDGSIVKNSKDMSNATKMVLNEIAFPGDNYWTISYKAYLMNQLKKSLGKMEDTVVYNISERCCRVAWNEYELALFGKPKLSALKFNFKMTFKDCIPPIVLSVLPSGIISVILIIFNLHPIIAFCPYFLILFAALTFNYFENRKEEQIDFIEKSFRKFVITEDNF